MASLDIDTRKLPPVKVNKQIIQNARDLLMQINATPTSQHMDLCSRYYTVLPHNFGRGLPPLIDNIFPHLHKLSVLEDIEAAMRVLESARDEPNMNCLDALLKKVGCDLKPEEDSLIKSLIEKLAAPDVNMIGEVRSILSVTPHDKTAFSKHEYKKNRQLLWLACPTMAAVLPILQSGARPYDRKFGKGSKLLCHSPLVSQFSSLV